MGTMGQRRDRTKRGRKKNVHICNVNDKTVRDERKHENP